MMKYCKFCNDEYSISGEHWYTNTKTGTLVCKIRSKDNARRWQANNRERQNELAKESYARNQEFRRHYQRNRRYGITTEEYQELWIKQGGKCAICRTSEWGGQGGTPQVDHDHNSLDIRGLLCSKCNRGIGFFNDDVAVLQSAINYLNMQNVMI